MYGDQTDKASVLVSENIPSASTITNVGFVGILYV